MAPEVAAERYEHGTRARYVLGRCRCFPCRVANAAYADTRAEARPYRTRHTGYGWWVVTPTVGGGVLFRSRERAEAVAERDRLNGQAEAGPEVRARMVRRHLAWLQTQGVGIHRVAEVSGVSRSAMQKLVRRRSKTVTQRTADRILAVGRGDTADGGLVDAGDTWEYIGCLRRGGWTKGRIAVALGASRPALQLRRDHVLGRTERAVRDLHDKVWLVEAAVRVACSHEGRSDG